MKAMSSKLIGVDLDGVLSAIGIEFCKYYNQMYGENISLSDIKSYRAEQWSGKTKEEIDQIFLNTPIFETVSRVSRSKESLELLKVNGWVIHIVTHRPWHASIRDVTEKWLRKNGYVFDALEFSESSDKTSYVKRHGMGIFVEDSRENAEQLCEVCQKVYLVDYPYNQGAVPGNVCRVKGWDEIIKDIVMV